MGQTSEESEGERELELTAKSMADVDWRCVVNQDIWERGTVEIPILPVREAETFEAVVFRYMYQAVGGYYLGSGWRSKYGLSQ